MQLAPDASAALSIYEHDALVTDGLPLRWVDAGDVLVAAHSPEDPRAVLFVHEAGASMGDPDDAFDDDACQAAPAMALGPGPDLRYLVDLSRPTWRTCCWRASEESGCA